MIDALMHLVGKRKITSRIRRVKISTRYGDQYRMVQYSDGSVRVYNGDRWTLIRSEDVKDFGKWLAK